MMVLVVVRNGTGNGFEIQCLLSRLERKKDGLADARCSANAACLLNDTRCVTVTGHHDAWVMHSLLMQLTEAPKD